MTFVTVIDSIIVLVTDVITASKRKTMNFTNINLRINNELLAIRQNNHQPNFSKQINSSEVHQILCLLVNLIAYLWKKKPISKIQSNLSFEEVNVRIKKT